MPDSALLLAIDTCGPSGSVALGRWSAGAVEILGQTELAGRTYSATLVAAIAGLLNQNQKKLSQLDAIVVVNGPGSFTGVRVGLSAAKGLAQGASLPVLAVSRLEVLAGKRRLPPRLSMPIAARFFCASRIFRASRRRAGNYWPARAILPGSILPVSTLRPCASPSAMNLPPRCSARRGRRSSSSPFPRLRPPTLSSSAPHAPPPGSSLTWLCSTAITCAAPMPRSSANPRGGRTPYELPGRRDCRPAHGCSRPAGHH